MKVPTHGPAAPKLQIRDAALDYVTQTTEDSASAPQRIYTALAFQAGAVWILGQMSTVPLRHRIRLRLQLATEFVRYWKEVESGCPACWGERRIEGEVCVYCDGTGKGDDKWWRFEKEEGGGAAEGGQALDSPAGGA